MALTGFNEEDGQPVLGLDMGDTSTDVSRFAGQYEQIFEKSISGVTIKSSQLDINTVASGGSSHLFSAMDSSLLVPSRHQRIQVRSVTVKEGLLRLLMQMLLRDAWPWKGS